MNTVIRIKSTKLVKTWAIIFQKISTQFKVSKFKQSSQFIILSSFIVGGDENSGTFKIALKKITIFTVLFWQSWNG